MTTVPTPTDNWRRRVRNPLIYIGVHRDHERQGDWVEPWGGEYVPRHGQPPAWSVEAGRRVFLEGRLPVVRLDDDTTTRWEA